MSMKKIRKTLKVLTDGLLSLLVFMLLLFVVSAVVLEFIVPGMTQEGFKQRLDGPPSSFDTGRPDGTRDR
jgi:hypothetical protein